MPINSFGVYTPNHKAYDHAGNIIPDIGHSEGIQPHLGTAGKVASWLPVQFYDKHFENWIVIMPGKAVAFDPDGCLMPAEYGLTSATVTYTSDDVTAGTIDVATGEAVTAAKAVTLASLTGTRGGSWTKALAGTNNSTYASGFMGRYGVSFNDSTAKFAIGVAPYAYLQWAGGDGINPTGYTYHNYNMQHRVAALCDYVIKLPLVPAQAASETVDKTVTNSALVIGTANVHTRAYAVANATGRYNATTGTVPVLSTYPVVAIALDNVTVAKNTVRTTIALASDNTSDDVSSILVNEKTALSAVTAAGDYFIDYEMGVIFIYSSDGSTLPTALSGASGTVSITYYHNASAPSTLSKFASVHAGAIVPGDFLKCGANSNLVVATPATDTWAVLGQVLCLETYPRGGLEYVRTAYNPALNTNATGAMANATASSLSSYPGQLDQMPGSATGGVTDQIHYAGAADTLVIINLINR